MFSLRGKQYGNPDITVMERLSDIGASIWRRLHGTIGRFAFSAKANPLILRLNAWFDKNGEYAAGLAFAIVGIVLALNAAGYLFPEVVHVGL